jgi:RNA polymerase sigma factor (sigma-70 family)
MGLDTANLKNKEEKLLIKRALTGENLAWKQILIRHKKVIVKAIKSHLYKFHDAYDEFKSEDIYQEVLLKLHKSALAQFVEKDSGAKLSSFIYTVALNTAKDYTKSKLGQAGLKEINPEINNEEGEETLETFVFIDEGKCSELLYEKEEERRILRDELIELEFENRRVIELYLSGEKNKEIANLTKIGEARINKMVFNFKKKLEKKYKKAS